MPARLCPTKRGGKPAKRLPRPYDGGPDGFCHGPKAPACGCWRNYEDPPGARRKNIRRGDRHMDCRASTAITLRARRGMAMGRAALSLQAAVSAPGSRRADIDIHPCAWHLDHGRYDRNDRGRTAMLGKCGGTGHPCPPPNRPIWAFPGGRPGAYFRPVRLAIFQRSSPFLA